jgi:hypothetical protein
MSSTRCHHDHGDSGQGNAGSVDLELEHAGLSSYYHLLPAPDAMTMARTAEAAAQAR